MSRMLSALCVMCGLSTAVLAQQEPKQAAAARPAFTIADIHDSPRMSFPFPTGGLLKGDRYSFRQATIVDLAARAYGVAPEMVQGGPSWIEMKRFDIAAKTDPRTTDADLKLMLQSLLADRFKLVLHKGEAPMPAFVLTAPGGKTKMKPSTEGEAKECQAGPPETAGGAPLIVITCTGMSSDGVASLLHSAANGYLTAPVVDQTGLEGLWDFTLKWTDVRNRAKAGTEAVSIFDGVDQGLGLKLELKTAPREVWIVDSVLEAPTPNAPDVAKALPPIPPAQFEVATIKPSRPDERAGGRVANGQVSLTATSLRNLIGFAWDLNLIDKQMLVNAPDWLEEKKFDIMAKAAMPEAVPGRPPAQVDDQELRQMLQALLIERFNMKVRMEPRPILAYTITADHPRLTPADPKSRTHCQEGPGPDGKDPRKTNPMITAVWTCQNITMKQLGEELARYANGYVYTPALDGTGLKGGYNFTLGWSSASLTILKPPPPPGEAQKDTSQGASEPNGAITLNEAMEKQLGLKLVKEKRPVPVLVIDHMDDTPTAN